MNKRIEIRVPVGQLNTFERERKRWQRSARKSDKSARITRNDVILLALESLAQKIEAEEQAASERGGAPGGKGN